MSPRSLPFDSTRIVPGSRICVAVSGGADSVALLCALSEANRSSRASLGVGLSAVHVHHGIREQEADADAMFVRTLCDRLDVPVEIHQVDVPAYRSTTGESLEEAARTLRYKIFRSVFAANGTDDLLTAHTQDDQAETVLMKLIRGAWTEGLGGIYPVFRVSSQQRILRPLLSTSRAQVVEYLQSIDQPWHEDTTNNDPSHTRNRIRHHLLPWLRMENPSIDQSLVNLAELAREEEDHWQDALARILPQLLLPGTPVRGGGRSVSTSAAKATVALEIDRLRNLDKATLRRVLRASAETLHLAEGEHHHKIRLSFSETERLMALCGFRIHPTISARPGSLLRLSQGLSAKRSARELVLSLDPASVPAKSRRKQ